MPHTATSPYGKLLEGIWWWIENDPDLKAFLDDPARNGRKNFYKLYDGTSVPGGDVTADECPCLYIDPSGNSGAPLNAFSASSQFGDCPPEATWKFSLWGHIDSLKFDIVSKFFSLSLAALNKGIKTNFAQGDLLQGDDQMIQHSQIEDAIPGALWLNPQDLEAGINNPQLSFFVINVGLRLSDAIGTIS